MFSDFLGRLRTGFSRSDEKRDGKAAPVQAVRTRMNHENAERLKRVRDKHASAKAATVAMRSKRARRRMGKPEAG